jgi:porin
MGRASAWHILILIGLAVTATVARGQEGDVNVGPAAGSPSSQPAPPPATQPVAPYSGGLLERTAFTGDWWGARNELADKGLKFDVQVVQYLQGNAYGGRSTAGAIGYSGTADYALNFDFQKMGLWPGGFGRIRGETKFGRSVYQDVGAILAPNFDALLPAPGQPGLTTLTEYWVMQFVSPKLGFIAGMVDVTALPGANVFASGRYDKFMNTAFWYDPVAFSTVPYAAMTAGAIYTPAKWLSGATLVIDSHGTPTESGFETAFHSPHGATVVQQLTFHVKPWGRAGNQRLYFTYSTRDRVALHDIDRLLLSGAVAPQFSRLGLGRTALYRGRNLRLRNVLLRAVGAQLLQPSPQSYDWAFWYDFDQYLYTCPDDPDQGFGLFGGFGWSPGEVNPAGQFYYTGLGGKGVIPTRPHDRYGIGYYYLNASNDLPGFFQANAEQGVELFYNIEVTPWLHITPDLQVIVNPGGNTGPGARAPAIVYGLRAQMSF